MSKIVIGFSRPKTWKPFAWAIMKVLNIPYDHVYIRFHSATLQRDIIYQASSTMVNFMGSKIFDDHNITVAEYEIPLSDESRLAMIQFAMDSAGTPYGVKEILGLLAVIVASWCGFSIKNPFKDCGKTWICSELASYVIKEYANVQLPKDYEDMTPRDVYDFISSLKL